MTAYLFWQNTTQPLLEYHKDHAAAQEKTSGDISSENAGHKMV